MSKHRKATTVKKFASLATIGALALAGALAVPLSASAHSAEVTGTSACTPDGTSQIVTVTVRTSNVPGNTEGEVKVIEPGNYWLYEWAEHHANHGLPALAPNASFTYQLTVPANAKSVKTTVQIDWKDGFSHDPSATIPLPGNCTAPIVEIPYPGLFGEESCGVKNDVTYTDPAWIEKYGHLVNGPWKDGNYKLVDGKWVVDGSAQIKPEFRATHRWAGTGSLSASDFRRWQMYPGTQPYVYEDKGVSNQTADPAAPCFVRPETPVKADFVLTTEEAPDCETETVVGNIATTVYKFDWNETTKQFDESEVTTNQPTSRPLTLDEVIECNPLPENREEVRSVTTAEVACGVTTAPTSTVYDTYSYSRDETGHVVETTGEVTVEGTTEVEPTICPVTTSADKPNALAHAGVDAGTIIAVGVLALLGGFLGVVIGKRRISN